MQIREQLERLIDAAVAACCEQNAHARAGSGRLSASARATRATATEASTVAMRSAKLAKKNPREIAQIIVDHLPRTT